MVHLTLRLFNYIACIQSSMHLVFNMPYAVLNEYSQLVAISVLDESCLEKN
jgi:hypothetical protein